jgi:hypothetical protein
LSSAWKAREQNWRSLDQDSANHSIGVAGTLITPVAHVSFTPVGEFHMNSDDVSQHYEQSLRDELKYWGDAFWRNEEAGEKRVTFYITLVTAVLAALVALSKLEDRFILLEFGLFVLVVVWIFGFLTMLRMVRRNLVTERYKFACESARIELKKYKYLPESYRALPDAKAEFHKKRWLEWLEVLFHFKTGGLAEIVSAINGMLSGIFIFTLLNGIFSFPNKQWVSLTFAIIVVVLVLWWQTEFAIDARDTYKEKLDAERQERTDS